MPSPLILPLFAVTALLALAGAGILLVTGKAKFTDKRLGFDDLMGQQAQQA